MCAGAHHDQRLCNTNPPLLCPRKRNKNADLSMPNVFTQCQRWTVRVPRGPNAAADGSAPKTVGTRADLVGCAAITVGPTVVVGNAASRGCGFAPALRAASPSILQGEAELPGARATQVDRAAAEQTAAVTLCACSAVSCVPL